MPSPSGTRPSAAATPTCSASSRIAERAVSQITYLYDQRQDAIAELARLQTTVQAVVEEMARSPLGRPAPGVAVAAASPARDRRQPGAATRGRYEPEAGAPQRLRGGRLFARSRPGRRDDHWRADGADQSGATGRAGFHKGPSVRGTLRDRGARGGSRRAAPFGQAVEPAVRRRERRLDLSPVDEMASAARRARC